MDGSRTRAPAHVRLLSRSSPDPAVLGRTKRRELRLASEPAAPTPTAETMAFAALGWNPWWYGADTESTLGTGAGKPRCPVPRRLRATAQDGLGGYRLGFADATADPLQTASRRAQLADLGRPADRLLRVGLHLPGASASWSRRCRRSWPPASASWWPGRADAHPCCSGRAGARCGSRGASLASAALVGLLLLCIGNGGVSVGEQRCRQGWRRSSSASFR